MDKALTLKVEDGVGIVTFDVPGESQNTLKPTFEEEFTEIVRQIEGDSSIKAVVMISGKDDTFIAGADVSMLKNLKTAQEGEAASRRGQEGMARWAKLRVPTVAAINGACMGGGLETALACTTRICTDDKKTVLSLPEVQLGLLPGAGGTQRLPKLVGLQTAMDMILTGKNIKPAKAKKIGLVEEVVPKAILKEAAVQLAKKYAGGYKPSAKKLDLKSLSDPKEIQRLALEETPFGRALMFKKAREMLEKKTKGHYPAPVKALEAIEAGVQKGAEQGYAKEAQGFGELLAGDVSKRLIEIFFATTALKKDNGVANKEAKPREVMRLGVLGGGLMGSGIAFVATQNGYQTRIREKDEQGAAGALKAVRKLYDDRLKKKAITAIERDQQWARLSVSTDFSGFKSADVVIEAVFEDLGLKQTMLKAVEKESPNVIFATNTSSIPIAKIAEAAQHPENVVGMHFFSPVNKMPLLEVIRGPKSSDEAVTTAVAIGKKMGKTVIVVKDGVAFYTTRIVGPYTNEAAHMLAMGVPIEQIDRALTNFGWPVGPIALMDEVGIDVGAKVAKIVWDAYGDRMAPPKGFEKLIADGRSGRKNKKGFYLYDEGAKKKKVPDESVYTVLGVQKNASLLTDQEIAERATLMFVNEAMHCYGDGILRSPRDGDIGAIFGLGFPPFLGGPFRWTDTMGAGEIAKKLEKYTASVGTRFTPAQALIDAARQGKKFY
ncbi:MAG: fatty acid oxidation complex subunit alpha FadJ [Deltaproteobacteria bacterium]|nr:fatty acid oxidation complex subunit alpha FadJ [Deltaproteobacteria bacterium]